MHIKLLTVIPLMVLALSGRSQELPPFKRIVKLYPLQLYKVFPTATIAYEHRVAYNLSVTLEAATYLDLSIVNAIPIKVESVFGRNCGITLNTNTRKQVRFMPAESTAH